MHKHRRRRHHGRSSKANLFGWLRFRGSTKGNHMHKHRHGHPHRKSSDIRFKPILIYTIIFVILFFLFPYIKGFITNFGKNYGKGQGFQPRDRERAEELLAPKSWEPGEE